MRAAVFEAADDMVGRLTVVIQAAWAAPTPADRAAALAVMAELATAATPEEAEEAEALAVPSATPPPPPPPGPTAPPTPAPGIGDFAIGLLKSQGFDVAAALNATIPQATQDAIALFCTGSSSRATRPVKRRRSALPVSSRRCAALRSSRRSSTSRV